MGGKLLYRDGRGGTRRSTSRPRARSSAAAPTAPCAPTTRWCRARTARSRSPADAGSSRISGSSNGTFVNEVRVQKQALNHADVVRCGTLQVRFVETADAARSAAATRQAAHDVDPGAERGAGGSVQVDPALQQAFGGGGGGLNPAALMQQKDYELQQASQERDMLAARLREASQELEAAQHRNEAQPGRAAAAARGEPGLSRSPGRDPAREVAAGRRDPRADQGRQRAARRARARSRAST